MINDLKKILKDVSLTRKDKKIITEYEDATRIFEELVNQGLAKKREVLFPMTNTVASLKLSPQYKNF